MTLKPRARFSDVLRRVNARLVSFLSPWSDYGYSAQFDWTVRGDDIEACIREMHEVQSVDDISIIRVWEDTSIMYNPTYQFEDTAVSDHAQASPVVRASRPWSLALPLPDHLTEIRSTGPMDEAGGGARGRPIPTGVAQATPLGGFGIVAGLQIGATFVVGRPS